METITLGYYCLCSTTKTYDYIIDGIYIYSISHKKLNLIVVRITKNVKKVQYSNKFSPDSLMYRTLKIIYFHIYVIVYYAFSYL
jgi:hypothetical protein